MEAFIVSLVFEKLCPAITVILLAIGHYRLTNVENQVKKYLENGFAKELKDLSMGVAEMHGIWIGLTRKAEPTDNFAGEASHGEQP